ncbi:unnamed protein product [Arabidopsis thaliana]|uniref:Uncharacterized protein n=1 Tax=Arabidopsis thaliana TaxID=3702 RepID=A0A654F8U4_ARATH|nr:unnamed protein product [Arabidopsis thaliana]
MVISQEEADNDHASGSKGSSVGENSLDSIESEEHDDDMSDASGSEESSDEENLVDSLMSEMINEWYDEMYDDLTDGLDDILAARIPSLSALRTSNKQPSDSNKTSIVFDSMKALHDLPGVRMWSPLYRASLTYFQADVTHREAFLAFSDPEDKICYLENKTGKKRDE